MLFSSRTLSGSRRRNIRFRFYVEIESIDTYFRSQEGVECTKRSRWSMLSHKCACTRQTLMFLVNSPIARLYKNEYDAATTRTPRTQTVRGVECAIKINASLAS